ncbi:hypothetical protein AB1N83_004558 [Pleurotus pulmonarius]
MSNIYRTKRPGIAEDAPTIDNVAGRKGSGDQNRPGAKSELRQGVRNYPPESDSESYQGARANFAHNERTATSSGGGLFARILVPGQRFRSFRPLSRSYFAVRF